jgi:ubiquinone/menaquinone biosynthesis C-methylase UbiE
MTVLDFGCGPGSFSVAAARLVGPSGHVHAVDANPLAHRYVERAAARRGLANVSTLLADRPAGIETASVDVVLLYDVLHNVSEPEALMADLHRVLKTDGTLSVSDHHMSEEAIEAAVTGGGRFRRTARHRKTISFQPGSSEAGS